MKKVFILLTLAFISINIYSQEKKVNWYTFEEAVEMNKKNPKKILIDVYTDWCGWCKKMKKNTFNHPEIAQFINNNFYPVRFDAESDEPVTFEGRTFTKRGSKSRSPHELAIALLNGKMSYPSVAYLDEKNRLITTVPGYYGPKDMELILKYFAKDAYKSQTIKNFRKNFSNTLVKE